MKNHTDLLIYIAQKINAKSYLEIGTNNGKNFNAIPVAHKVGVDPDLAAVATVHKTSSEFFHDNKETFQLIFIDGLHEAEQVKEDIIYAWACLETGGVIVVHDCNPEREGMTHQPRDAKIWCGDVWKTICELKDGFTIDMDYGCFVDRKEESDDRLNWKEDFKISWKEFDRDRVNLLNLISVKTAEKIIDSWT